MQESAEAGVAVASVAPDIALTAAGAAAAAAVGSVGVTRVTAMLVGMSDAIVMMTAPAAIQSGPGTSMRATDMRANEAVAAAAAAAEIAIGMTTIATTVILAMIVRIAATIVMLAKADATAHPRAVIMTLAASLPVLAHTGETQLRQQREAPWQAASLGGRT